jgi:hypothetical protein
MKILHISHHIGCMRDHAFIYETFGFIYEFWKFYKGAFHISKQFANQIWQEKKEYFNTFDFIVTSDTAPLSRIFMENIPELKPKIVVWICNRFDYAMEHDASYYELFRNISIHHKDQFKIIPYSKFEKMWCNIHNISEILDEITPIGMNPIELDVHIDSLQTLKDQYIYDNNSKEQYTNPTDLNGKIFISIYGNDNLFFHLSDILNKNNIPCFNGGYHHSSDLKYCKGLVTFPDQYSKLATYETIHNQIIVFLPTRNFLIQLHPTTNNNVRYWFNSPVGLLDDKLIHFCEWYRFENCRIYFDSIDDLIFKINHLTPEIILEKKKWCSIYSKLLIEENIEKWKQIFI